ncbi:MAG: hypothetical protein Q4F57_10200 [Weeksellaceae bacterium]|nr:hypothetical protein [Weeksellaceae bacterium]
MNTPKVIFHQKVTFFIFFIWAARLPGAVVQAPLRRLKRRPTAAIPQRAAGISYAQRVFFILSTSLRVELHRLPALLHFRLRPAAVLRSNVCTFTYHHYFQTTHIPSYIFLQILRSSYKTFQHRNQPTPHTANR